MTDTPKPVQVVEVTTNGIRAVIYGKDLAWNKTKDQFFVRLNGKWTQTKVTALQEQILKERHASKLWKSERIRNARTEPRRYSAAHCERQEFLAQERNA